MSVYIKIWMDIEREREIRIEREGEQEIRREWEIQKSTCSYNYIDFIRTQIYKYIDVYIHVYVHVQHHRSGRPLEVYISTYIYAYYIDIHICTCVYTHTPIYLCIYIYTHTHKQIYRSTIAESRFRCSAITPSAVYIYL